MLLFIIPLLASCKLFDREEAIPAFVHIESLSFYTNSSSEGSESHQITEVWVYADGDMMGAYDLPADVPILKEGNVNITMLAGIKNNGISSTRLAYPFYESYEQQVNLVPGQTDTINPSFTYKSDLKFWREDFDNQLGHKFESTIYSDTNLVIIDEISHPGEVFEGEGSGKAVLLSGMNRLEIFTNDDNFEIDAGKRAWVEMDYNCNNSFAVGLIVTLESGSTIKSGPLVVYPTTDDAGEPQWNKIYIELTQFTANYLSAQSFDLYIQGIKDDDVAESVFIFDNIKVVQFDI